MAPENVECLRVARPDVCTLANNHVLDFGGSGLAETCAALADAGIPYTGAGRDAGEAGKPVITTIAGSGGRVITYSYGSPSSGVPPDWAATVDRSGVNLLPALTPEMADDIIGRAQQERSNGDIVVVSVHWGSNWGYGLSAEQVEFAHRLIDGGVDVIHGHSSHHVRPIELYRGKLILYGCGDLINDYEGISGYQTYRDDLRLLYFAMVEPGGGSLVQLRMVPMQARQLRLWHASGADVDHLLEVINQTSEDLGVRARAAADRTLLVTA
jgi:poly-gamma-glutamate synthesis protein (capsule biosynthesis protein)